MTKVAVTRVCPICGTSRTFYFDKSLLEEGMRKCSAGALIQNAFPRFTAEEREFLLTGICDDCWNKMGFGFQ